MTLKLVRSPTEQHVHAPFHFHPASTLETIVAKYDLILFDTSFFTSDNNLCEKLFDAKLYRQLQKLDFDLDNQQEHLDWLSTLITKYPQIQSLRHVTEELRYLSSHFHQVYDFHSLHWKKIQQESITGKFKPLRKNLLRAFSRRYNQHLEQTRKQHHQTPLEERHERHLIKILPSSIQALADIYSKIETMRETLPIYNSSIYPLEPQGKASITDCTLVGAAVGYALDMTQTQSRAAICTSDFDLIMVLRGHLHNISPDINQYLSQVVHIYMNNNLEKQYVRRIE